MYFVLPALRVFNINKSCQIESPGSFPPSEGMADDGQGRRSGLFGSLGFTFSPTPKAALPGSVRQVRGAAYPPLQAPISLAEAAELAAARQGRG